ncbi:MAG: MoxR family ATPase [Dermabacter sp.]|nr:MoxR family ATPase [Dermabacter sp.]
MSPHPTALDVERVQDLAIGLVQAVETVIEGKSEAVRLTVLTLLAGGHLLIEDVPGTGKTLLAKTLAASLGAQSQRVQFTPDLLPSDITGASVFNQATREFDFRPGAVFTNVLLADEINRASPKTQSALLEAMEEHAVSVDGTTHALAHPFMVIATSNPVEMDGTYDLPEAQRDRFLVKLSMGYPSASAEVRMLAAQSGASDATHVDPVTSPHLVTAAMAAVRTVHTSPSILEYVVSLARATRESPALRLGVSPRATVHALRVAKAHAIVQGRGHVLPSDVQAVLAHVWAHRIHLSPRAAAAGATDVAVLAAIMESTPVLDPHDGR